MFDSIVHFSNLPSGTSVAHECLPSKGNCYALSKADASRTGCFGNFVKEQGAAGLFGVTGGNVYVLHSPSFWALATLAFGVVFFLFHNS